MKKNRIMKNLILLTIITVIVLSTSCSSLINIERLDMPTERPIIGIEDYSEVLDKGPEYGGTLKIASNKYDTLNPLFSQNYFMKDVFGLVFEGLVALDESYKPQPLLCETFGSTTDCLTWTYNIKKNVKWHDGSNFTAHDVKFTIDSLKQEQNSYYSNCVKNISEVVVTSTYTVTITYETPDSFAASKMIFPILPKHVYELDGGGLNKSKSISPVGTGMYKIKSISDKGLALVVNDSWHGEKKPYIENVQVDFYSSLNDIINSQADIISVKSDDISKGQGKIGYGIKKYINPEHVIFAMNNSKNIFAEPEVRRAIAYALNKDSCVKKVIGDYGVLSDLPIYPQSWINPTNTSYFSYDTNKAVEILENSGWTIRNDKWYKVVNGSGTYLEFECLVNQEYEDRIKIAENMASELKKANIIMKVKKVKGDALIKDIESSKFDAAIVGMNISSLGDINLFFTTGNDETNITGYSNPAVDSLFNQLKSNSFENQKAKIFESIKEKIVADVPLIGLYFKEDAVFFKKRIKGIAESKINKENRLRGINNWYIPGSSGKQDKESA